MSTLDELAAGIGAQVRALRIAQRLDQRTLAEAANVSISAVRGLERGQGSSLTTLLAVVRALGRSDWLDQLYPETDRLTPMQRLRAQRRLQPAPQRVRRTRALG